MQRIHVFCKFLLAAASLLLSPLWGIAYTLPTLFRRKLHAKQVEDKFDKDEYQSIH